MKQNSSYTVKLDDKAFFLFAELAEILSRPIEDVLSDTLSNYADIVLRDTGADIK